MARVRALRRCFITWTIKEQQQSSDWSLVAQTGQASPGSQASFRDLLCWILGSLIHRVQAPANQGAALGRLRQDCTTKTGVATIQPFPFVTHLLRRQSIPGLVHTIWWSGGTRAYCVVILYGVLYCADTRDTVDRPPASLRRCLSNGNRCFRLLAAQCNPWFLGRTMVSDDALCSTVVILRTGLVL